MSRRRGSDAKLGRDLIGGGDSIAVEAYRERLLSALEIGPGRGRRALDLGCGDGMEAEYLARLGWRVEALDLQPHPAWKKVQRRWRGKIRFRTGDAASLKKLKGGYDLVFEKDMLHHVPRPVPVLKEMKRLTKKGGTAYVVECNRYNPVFYLHLTLLGGHQHFTRSRLRALLAEAGWKGYGLRLREARVWPVESKLLQKLADWAQELVERVRVFDPWLCYHLVRWENKRG